MITSRITSTCREKASVFVGLLLSATLLATSAWSQSYSIHPRFQRHQLEDGLSQSSVVTMLQDRQGFIWMGTQDGLNRYDGYHFLVFKTDPEDSNSLASPNILSLDQDADGHIWIGIDTGGFSCFNPVTLEFNNYRQLLKDSGNLERSAVYDLDIDSAGHIWMATLGDGVLHFDPKNEILEVLAHEEGNEQTILSDDVLGIMVDDQDQIWIGSDGGLTQLNPRTGEMRHFRHDPDDPTSLCNESVQCIAPGSGNTLWVGTADGLAKLNRNTGTFRNYLYDPDHPTSLSGRLINAVMEDPNGKVWVATENDGLNLLDPEMGTCRLYRHDPYDQSSLSYDEVESFLLDHSGVLWIGTGNGVNRLDSRAKQFDHVCNRHGGLSNNCIWSLLEDSSGLVWIGTEVGLNQFNMETNQTTQLNQDPDDPSLPSYRTHNTIFEDSRGFIWLGSGDGSLDRYDPRTRVFTAIQAAPGEPEGPDSDRIHMINEDSEGRLWMGSYAGLECYDPATGHFTTYGPDPDDPNSIPDGPVRTLAIDSRDRIWAGIWGFGICCLDPRTGDFNFYRAKPNVANSLSNSTVLCIYEDSSSRIWVATNAGLNVLDQETGTWLLFLEKDGLPNNTIYGICEDNSGFLWISTNKGLCRFDPRTGKSHTYVSRDGTQNNEYNLNGYHHGKSGRMYFGGLNGFTFFYPDSIRNNPYSPPVVITDFRIFNKPLTVGEKHEGKVILDKEISAVDHIDLAYKDNVISFEFSALHFASPEKNRYAYLMEGFETHWNYVGNRNFATYTNLPPGDFVFRVRGTNNDGLWNNDGTSISLTVHPPFYRRAWFISLTLLTVLGLAYGLHLYRTRLLAIRTRELERVVTERTSDLTRSNQHLQEEIAERKRIEKALREAKDEAEAATRAKSNFLANMSHEIRTPMNGVLGMTSILLDSNLPPEQQDYCDMIRSSANNLLVVINDILDFSKIEAGKLDIEDIDFNLREIVDEVIEIQALQAETKNLQFTCIFDPQVPSLLRGDPIRLRQILLNLTNNAIKFTDFGEVNITVTLRKNEAGGQDLIFQVQDTGVGIPVDRVENIFGSFSQVDPSTTRKFGGTGLGLAIAKQLTELMGGAIWLESQVGKGTTFWFSLTCKPSQERAEPKFSTRGLGVLVMHDNPPYCRGLMGRLTYFDCRGELVANENQARQAILAAAERGEPIQAMIINNAGQNRPAHELRKLLGPADLTRDLPLILMCDREDPVEPKLVNLNGYLDTLTCPVTHRKLRLALKKITVAGEEDQAALSTYESAEMAHDNGPLILLAEDNMVNQKVASLILAKIGYQVDVVATGLEALEAVSQRDYVAVLMDVQMPEMDGLEAVRRIRAANSSARNPAIPIIALTAHAMEEDRRISIEAGMNDHIAKPINSEILAKILKRFAPLAEPQFRN